jgi:hypothetical protein
MDQAVIFPMDLWIYSAGNNCIYKEIKDLRNFGLKVEAVLNCIISSRFLSVNNMSGMPERFQGKRSVHSKYESFGFTLLILN